MINKKQSYIDELKNVRCSFTPPIAHRENMKLFLDRKTPIWMPDLYSESVFVLPDFINEKPNGHDGDDWFGVHWIWDNQACAAVEAPGRAILDDITRWKAVIKFPDLNAFDWKKDAENYKPNRIDGRMTIHRGAAGPFERLHAVMGFENALLSLITEPEATFEFLDAVAEHKVRLYKKLIQYYSPLDMIISPDDWGTQRSGFFSEEMFTEMILPHTKKIVDSVKDEGVYYMQHSCGNNEKYISHMIDIGIDVWEAQRSANDILSIQKEFGSNIGINILFALDFTDKPEITRDAAFYKIHRFVDTYGSNGGMTSRLRVTNEDLNTLCAAELFEYSRQHYAKLGNRR